MGLLAFFGVKLLPPPLWFERLPAGLISALSFGEIKAQVLPPKPMLKIR